MSKPRILVQLDTDDQPSVFDSVVAADAGVEHLLRHQGVTSEAVRDLTHGAMFTRGPEDLRHTAIFVGGSDVAEGERVLAQIQDCFFGPMRVSVMLDSSGANTTAAAAVIAVRSHLDLSQTTALVLAATGSVGRRVVRLLAREGAAVHVASRTLERAQDVCADIATEIDGGRLTPHATIAPNGLAAALKDVQCVIAAGAPGVPLLPAQVRQKCDTLKVAIDLSAVPPAGIEGIEANDKASERDGVLCYGAIGIGRTKMKIHKAAVRRLFEANDLVLDAEQIYELGSQL